MSVIHANQIFKNIPESKTAFNMSKYVHVEPYCFVKRCSLNNISIEYDEKYLSYRILLLFRNI